MTTIVLANEWSDALGSSLGALFSPSVLLLLLIGVLVGAVVGLLPGLGALVALTLMLPFTFVLSPFESFALLLGAYAVIATTGDLTSILVGVPGQPDSAALILDGYPMTQQGQANRAMGAAVASGTIGAVIGAGALLVSIPILRPLVLQLGSAETFMLALLGIAVVGSVSGRSILKGIIAGGIGLLLAAVGTSAQTGLPRFTFGSLYLFDGLPLIPMAVGMFALVELVELHRRRGSVAMTRPADGSTAWEGVRDTLRHRGALIRGSLIGAAVGIVPGVGGAVSQWMSYGSAMAISRTPERFGRGAVEGVIAPGACNNSKEGGQLIPTVGFGIPGSAAMAVLLGAFLIQGINPGPEMLTTHLDITLFMVWILVLANILGSLLCFPFLRHIAKVTFVRAEILVPFVLMMVLIGAASSSGVVGDLVLALAAGAVAWIMKRFGWPVVPLLLGLVLGGTAENSLLITMGVHGPVGWLLRPGVVVIAVLIAVAVWAAYRTRRRGDTAAAALDPDSGPVAPGPGSSLLGALVTGAVALVALVQAVGFPEGSRSYPTVIAGITLAASVVLALTAVWATVRRRRSGTDPDPSEGRLPAAGTGPPSGPPAGLPGRAEPDPVAAAPAGEAAMSLAVKQRATVALTGSFEDETSAEGGNRRLVTAVLWFVGAAVLSVLIGFTWTTLLFTATYLRVVGTVSIARSVLSGAIFAALVHVVFVVIFRIALPDPLLAVWQP